MNAYAPLIELLEAIEQKQYASAESALGRITTAMATTGYTPNAACAIEILRDRMKDAEASC